MPCDDVAIQDRNYFLEEARVCGEKSKQNLTIKDYTVLHRKLLQALSTNDRDVIINILLMIAGQAELEFDFFYEVLADKKLEKTKDYIYTFAVAFSGKKDTD